MKHTGDLAMRYFLLIVCGFLLAGCSLVNGHSSEDEVLIEQAPIIDAEVVSIEGSRVTLALTGEWFNTCGTFNRADVVQASRANMYQITLYGQQPSGVDCGDAITPFSGTVEAVVLLAGTYWFGFDGPAEGLSVTLPPNGA